jgi:hypothetical protein
MKASAKVGLIFAGYIVALLIAFAVVAINAGFRNAPDALASGGMFAFGDSLLFLAVFGLAAIPATCAALYFLKPFRSFWISLSAAALIVSTTGIAALVDYVATQSAEAGSAFHSWSALAVLRILVAPLFAVTFFLSAFFAPNRSPRLAFVFAAMVETVVFTTVALMWFDPFTAH